MARLQKIIVHVNDEGEWVWTRKASNGRLVFESQGFESKDHALANVHSENSDQYNLVIEDPEVTIAVPATDEENNTAADYGTVSPVGQAESPTGTDLS